MVTSYEQFARYIYKTFQSEIDVSKGTQKNKYIKIRNDILKYIVTNRGNYFRTSQETNINEILFSISK